MMIQNLGQAHLRDKITLSQRNPSHYDAKRNSNVHDNCAIRYLHHKLVFVLLAVLLIATPIFAAIVSYSPPELNYKTIVVSQGDTLWAIAKRVKSRTDPRKTIYQIRQLNDLESVNLRPGQTLIIPL
jgi:hypothetical protein